MSQSEDVREVLTSVATGALLEAQADAERSGKLIFRDEWKPTPRFRSSTTQLTSPPAGDHSQSPPWISLRNYLGLYSLETTNLAEEEARSPKPASAPAPASEPATEPVSAPPPKHADVPVSSTSFEIKPQPKGAVAKLLRDNENVYNKLINHPFPNSLGDGTASLDGFRYYMIQDTKYLELCARLKMLAVARSPDFKAIEDFDPRHKSSLEYVKQSKEFLSSWLGVPESIISTTPRDKCLNASEKHYIKSTQDEDAWLAYYVVLLPCVLAYWKIAERLMDSPSTVRNTVYFPTWIENNYDRHSADKYIKFLNENIETQGGDIDRWSSIFGTACQLEVDIFDTGRQAPKPYMIVPDGIYSIQNFSANKVVVIANQDIKNVDPELSVIAVNKTGGEDETWHVVATKDGYTIQSVGTELYLGIPTTRESQRLQSVVTGVKPHYWWINPVRKQPSWYQICATENLRYTLQAEEKVITSTFIPITPGDNFSGSYQMWSFKPEQREQPATSKLEPNNHSPGAATTSRECSGFPTGRFRIRAAGKNYYWTCQSWNSKKEGNLICTLTLSPGHNAQIFRVNSEGHLCIETGLKLDVSGNALVLTDNRERTEPWPNPWSHPLPTFSYGKESKIISVKFYTDPLVSASWPRSENEWKDKEFVLAARSVASTKALDFPRISKWAPGKISSARKFRNTVPGFQAHTSHNLGVEESAMSTVDNPRFFWELESVEDPSLVQ